jgi:hypothetical protein
MKLWRIAFMMLAFSLVSCSSHMDGDWDSMVWKAEVPVVYTTDGIYDVSADGDTFMFTCRNYSSPWIECATSGEKHYFPPRENNDFHTIMTDWFKAEIVGHKLNVTFETNKEDDIRPLELTVTAGDIFYTFKFKQFANTQK